MLAAAPHTAYIHEPFNIRHEFGVTPKAIRYWFQHVGEENSALYERAIAKVLRFHYPLAGNLLKVRAAGDLRTIARDQGLSWWHKLKRDTPIVKDPIAIFSAEWLSDRFDMNVLVMIRHPAAFCSSVRLKAWQFDFNNLLQQPALMEKYLGRFEREISEHAAHPRDIIEQACLLWNCIYHTVAVYQKNRPEWLYVRHKDLSLDPVNRFRAIYQAFDLQFTDRSKAAVLESSAAHHAVEGDSTNDVTRNSKAIVHAWKQQLKPAEIDLIRERTSEVSELFYSENEW